MAIIELNYDSKKLGNVPVTLKVKIIKGAYPIIITETPPVHGTQNLGEMITNLAVTYQLDLSRITVIAHYVPEPLRMASGLVEWAYFDLKDQNSQVIDFGRSSVVKLNDNLVNAILEQSGLQEEMHQKSKPNGILLQTETDKGWDIYLTFNDGKRELEATITHHLGLEKARNVAKLIALSRGFNDVQEN